MLQCADRTFYVGQTDNLDIRLAQHQAGTFKGYTETRRPVHLVWAAETSSREEARAFELRLKGWRREKKLALIRGDWEAISELARGYQKEGRASTGSAQPALGWVRDCVFMHPHPHPSSRPSEPFCLQASLRPSRDRLRARFSLTGPIRFLDIPPRTTPSRADNLWRRTCFELFAQTQAGYIEYNLSPSTEWAAYRFSGYRAGMRALNAPPPLISVQRSEHVFTLSADLSLPEAVSRIGLSAVVEEISGRKSYWALRHPPGDTPDFHHPDCFALEVPPASGS